MNRCPVNIRIAIYFLLFRISISKTTRIREPLSKHKTRKLNVTKDLLNRDNNNLRNISITTQIFFIRAVLSYLTTIYAKNILQKYQFATIFKRIPKNSFSSFATGHAESECKNVKHLVWKWWFYNEYNPFKLSNKNTHSEHQNVNDVDLISP